MNKKFIVGLAGFAILFIISASGALAAEMDQTKKQQGILVSSNNPAPSNIQPGGASNMSLNFAKVQVQDFSKPAIKGGIDGPIDSQGVVAPIDSKAITPIDSQHKGFDVFHKHTGEIKAAFGKPEVGELIGSPDSQIDGPDELMHKKSGGEKPLEYLKIKMNDVLVSSYHKGEGGSEPGSEGAAVDAFHKSESQGILIGMHKGEGEAEGLIIQGGLQPGSEASLKVREAAIKGQMDGKGKAVNTEEVVVDVEEFEEA